MPAVISSPLRTSTPVVLLTCSRNTAMNVFTTSGGTPPRVPNVGTLTCAQAKLRPIRSRQTRARRRNGAGRAGRIS